LVDHCNPPYCCVYRDLFLCCSLSVPRKRPNHAMQPMHVYEVRPRKDHRGVDLISDALPFGRLWYGEPNAVSNAMATRCTAADHMMP
jgi:hypothetical protein